MGEDFPVEVPAERKDEFKRLVKVLADGMNKASEDKFSLTPPEDYSKNPKLKRLIR